MALLLVTTVSVGCAGVKDQRAGADGQPGRDGAGGGGGRLQGRDAGIPSSDGNCAHELRLAVRDFRGHDQDGKPKHPDFEQAITDDRGIVATTLATDSKPLYAGASAGTVTTTGKANFDQWYRDIDGVNIHIDVSVPLTADPARAGVFVYDNDAFFPIDKMGWPDPYADHNHDFTAEMHFTFPYRGGEVFNFRGDDDVFVFINGRLAIDLGGIHIAEMGRVDLDTRAAELGIAPGNTYEMAVFYADRHCCDSTFHIETTLQCITNVIVP
ncbi:MAG TPA: fibro-slime domain-containing protein [Polyangia bacterium]|nr:fibro-slime domain-containing protein [Polyangia bacterium]